jgi:hypothetical protein
MQRHFSNRGEALAEVTAARVLARRKAPANSAFTARAAAGRFPSGQWFMKPTVTTQRPKTKQQPKHDEDFTPLL